MSRWDMRNVPFKFQLSDITLFSTSVPLQMRSETLVSETSISPDLPPAAEDLLPGSEGFVVRALPIAEPLPVVCKVGDYIRYVPLQYQHCYIDLTTPFHEYVRKFSSKTRSTINRKIKKYAEHCGGQMHWKTYRTADDMTEFLAHARVVSCKSYQERLLDAGIPDSTVFREHARALAANNRVRAYVLFDRDRPVSYLYCPVNDGVLIYAYLGYDPDYARMSVGTVLQWLAVEQMFAEGCFRYFDFTEGESEHKRLFATHRRRCANVFFIRSRLRNRIVILGQVSIDKFSKWVGNVLEDVGLKTRMRNFLRFGGLTRGAS